MTNNNRNKITVKNLKKMYNNEIVLDIDHLEIDRGQIVAILGKNGSGKSTLIKIISGLLYQDEGDVCVFSFSNKDKNIRNITKFVQESGKGYYDYLTAQENIEYFLGLNKVNIVKVQEKLDDFIDRFEFREHLYKKVSELSQGNRQKLSIIISLLTSPEILLLDEPTNGLDLLTSDFLLNNLKKISDEENKTILLTTHDLNFIKSLDVRCIILKDGLIIADDTVDNLVDKDDSVKYRIVMLKSNLKKLDMLNLKNIRYSYHGEYLTLDVYDEDSKNKIIDNIDVIEFRKEKLDMEDVYYRVIKNE